MIFISRRVKQLCFVHDIAEKECEKETDGEK